jgi:hypothetical protein
MAALARRLLPPLLRAGSGGIAARSTTMGREGLLLTVSPSASPFSSTSPLRRLLVSDASPRSAAARLALPPLTSRRVATATPTSPARLGTMNPLALARQLQLQILQPAGHLGGGGNFTRGIVSESACGGRPAAPRKELVTDPLAEGLARPISPLPPPPPPLEGVWLRAFTTSHTKRSLEKEEMILLLEKRERRFDQKCENRFLPLVRQILRTATLVLYVLGSCLGFGIIGIKLDTYLAAYLDQLIKDAHALHDEGKLMMKKDPDEAFQLLERALSKFETAFRFAPFLVLHMIVSIRLEQASFYGTCSPPQPARVRDYLDKAAAKCEESKHMLINYMHLLKDVIVRPKSQHHNDARAAFRQLEVIEYMEGVYGYLGYLGGASNRGSAPTQPLKCLEQAAAKHAEALRVSILNHNSDNAAQSMKELNLILLDFLVPSLMTRGSIQFDVRFISDHRESIHTITSICESALKNYMQNDSDCHGPDHRIRAFDLNTMLAVTFFMLAWSDLSFFLPGRRSEYFKKARTNAELAVAANVQWEGKTGVAVVELLAVVKDFECANGILRAGITFIKLFIAYHVWKISFP